jgi:uncharacterized membrane protein
MTVDISVELAIWLAACCIGLTAAVLSLRYAILICAAFERTEEDWFTIDAARHLRLTQALIVIGWCGFLVAGILALLDTTPASSLQAPTTFGMLIRWTLLGVIVLWSFKTSSAFWFTHSRWERIQAGSRHRRYLLDTLDPVDPTVTAPTDPGPTTTTTAD